MDPKEKIYILGSGAIGFPLAAYLADTGRDVVAVRTSRNDVQKSTISVTVHNGANHISIPVETISLSKLPALNGTIVIATKSYTNNAIALELENKEVIGPIVIMQNGVAVEKPFLDAHFSPIYRCILLLTSQAISEYEFTVRAIASSPIGVVEGNESDLKKCVEDLTTDGFPFHAEVNIQKDIWKKAIINCVFNSICPLLDVDNGVFVRNKEIADLAAEIVRECITLTDRFDMGLSESELMEQIMRISKGSDGILISTLQDIRGGRQTEIESLNLEMARVAAEMQPGLDLPRTECLGKMILAKSMQKSMHRR